MCATLRGLQKYRFSERSLTAALGLFICGSRLLPLPEFYGHFALWPA